MGLHPSMLRGKTLEEIVNRWNLKPMFGNFAAEVAVRDRALRVIENGMLTRTIVVCGSDFLFLFDMAREFALNFFHSRSQLFIVMAERQQNDINKLDAR
jgi:hypothetical protein